MGTQQRLSSNSRHGIDTADSPLIIGFTVRLCKHACLSGNGIVFFHAVLCARSLGSIQLLYQRNGSGKDLGKDVCLSHLHLEPENNAIPGRLPPLQSWQDQRSNPIQLRRNLRLENTWLAVLSSSSRASTGQARPHKRSFSPSGSPPKPCPSSGASSQVSTPEESPPKETQKNKSGGTRM